MERSDIYTKTVKANFTLFRKFTKTTFIYLIHLCSFIFFIVTLFLVYSVLTASWVGWLSSWWTSQEIACHQRILVLVKLLGGATESIQHSGGISS